MTLLRTAATDASAARSLATASAEQAELVRAQWTEAAQRTKGLEKLKERHRAAQQAAEDAAEERAVDDLVTGRAGRGPTSRRRPDRRGGAVDGVMQVQARISEIQARFVSARRPASAPAGRRPPRPPA